MLAIIHTLHCERISIRVIGASAIQTAIVIHIPAPWGIIALVSIHILVILVLLSPKRSLYHIARSVLLLVLGALSFFRSNYSCRLFG
jgi:hypothetical protein